MEHPKAIGDRTTLAVMLALRDVGYAVLLPFGENTRYDLVIDDGEALARVQCKTGRLRAGAIRFPTCSTYGHHRHPGESRRHYQGQIDYFAVYLPGDGWRVLRPDQRRLGTESSGASSGADSQRASKAHKARGRL